MQAIFLYTFKEHLRRKSLLVVSLFGLILLAGATVVSALAAQERARMMLDLGLAANELIGLVLAVFTSVNLILKEIESRSIQLILAHPIRRSRYVVGRFLGASSAVVCAMALMGVLHVAALKLYGWHGLRLYALAWSCAAAKTAVMSALSLLLSLALTSGEAAMAFSGFLWVLGHFTGELRYLAEHAAGKVLGGALSALVWIAPNFAYFDARDYWRAASAPSGAWYGWLALYAASYVAAMLALSCRLFARKEF
jgi:Cu-processing system permease protein